MDIMGTRTSSGKGKLSGGISVREVVGATFSSCADCGTRGLRVSAVLRTRLRSLCKASACAINSGWEIGIAV